MTKCFTCGCEFKDDDLVFDYREGPVHADTYCAWSAYRLKVPNFRYSHMEPRRFKPLPTPSLPASWVARARAFFGGK